MVNEADNSVGTRGAQYSGAVAYNLVKFNHQVFGSDTSAQQAVTIRAAPMDDTIMGSSITLTGATGGAATTSVASGVGALYPFTRASAVSVRLGTTAPPEAL